MTDHLVGGRVHVYEYGEASGDLRTAFYVDERAYEIPIWPGRYWRSPTPR